MARGISMVESSRGSSYYVVSMDVHYANVSHVCIDYIIFSVWRIDYILYASGLRPAVTPPAGPLATKPAAQLQL